MRLYKEYDILTNQDLKDILEDLSNRIVSTLESFNSNKESFSFYIEFDDDKNNSQSNKIYFQWVVYRNLALAKNNEYSSYFKQKDYIDIKNDVSSIFYSLKNSIINFFDALYVADTNYENITNYFSNDIVENLVTRVLDQI